MSSKAKEGNRICKRSLEKAIKIEDTKAYRTYHFKFDRYKTDIGNLCLSN